MLGDERDGGTPQHQEAATAPAPRAALVPEVFHAAEAEWRAVIVAILGAILGLLAAQLFDGSDDTKTIGAIVGAAAGASLKAVADRRGWRDRTLTAIAVGLGVLGMPKARSAILGHAAAAGSATASATSPGVLLLSTTVIAASGAGAGLAVAGGTEMLDSDRSHPLEGRWQTTRFASDVNPDDPRAGFLAETWDIAERCRGGTCAPELSATTSAGVRVPQRSLPVDPHIGEGAGASDTCPSASRTAARAPP